MSEEIDWAAAEAEFKRRGYVVLRGAERANWALSRLASFIGSQAEGVFEHAISEISFEPGVTPKEGSLAYSASGLTPHTDGSFEPEPPTDLLMECWRADEPGHGVTTVVDCREIVTLLEKHQVDILTAESFVFGRTEGEKKSVVRVPVLTWREDAPHIRYREDSKYAVEALTSAGAAALAALRTRILAEGSQYSVPLAEGDIIWLDNRRALHGRTPLSGLRSRRMRRVRLTRP
jgi:alpha-ketoglutarate-dependent taurine dioxygenase